MRGYRAALLLATGMAGVALAGVPTGGWAEPARPEVSPACDLPPEVCAARPVVHYGMGAEKPPGPTTDDIARDTSRGDFTAIAFNTVTGPRGTVVPVKGVVGVDIALGDEHTPKYAVCGNVDDPYHGACSNATRPGYTFVKNWYAGGRTNFGAGLVIGNTTNKDSCPAPCLHYWGQRVVRVDVELYPKTDEGVTDIRYVRPRFAQFAHQFVRRAFGGTYGRRVGPVQLSRLGDPGTASLDGIVRRFGIPVRAGDVALRFFQQDATAVTATGQRLQSFATPNTLADGTFTTGAVYSGRYLVRAIDKVTGGCRELRNVVLAKVGHRLELELSLDDYGQDMTPC